MQQLQATRRPGGEGDFRGAGPSTCAVTGAASHRTCHRCCALLQAMQSADTLPDIEIMAAYAQVIPMLAGDATDQTPPDLPSFLFKERIVYLVSTCSCLSPLCASSGLAHQVSAIARYGSNLLRSAGAPEECLARSADTLCVRIRA